MASTLGPANHYPIAGFAHLRQERPSSRPARTPGRTLSQPHPIPLRSIQTRRPDRSSSSLPSLCLRAYLADDDHGPLALQEILLSGCPSVGVRTAQRWSKVETPEFWSTACRLAAVASKMKATNVRWRRTSTPFVGQWKCDEMMSGPMLHRCIYRIRPLRTLLNRLTNCGWNRLSRPLGVMLSVRTITPNSYPKSQRRPSLRSSSAFPEVIVYRVEVPKTPENWLSRLFGVRKMTRFFVEWPQNATKTATKAVNNYTQSLR